MNIYYLKSCIDCGHCRLYYIEKRHKRYYCDSPNKKSFYISDPHKVRSELCEDFFLCKKTSEYVKVSVCEDLQKTILDENRDKRGYFTFDTHEKDHANDKIVVHHHMDKILKHIDTLENDQVVTPVKDLVDSYFSMAAYSLLRIAEIETP